MPARTRFAALLLLGILGVWLVAMALVVRAAQLPGDAGGRMLAVFPPGHDHRAILLATARADGVLVRPTWLGLAWEVHGDPGLAGRLREEGAVLVLEPVAFTLITTGGCSFDLMPALAARDIRTGRTSR
jgi:hypothetical protein